MVRRFAVLVAVVLLSALVSPVSVVFGQEPVAGGQELTVPPPKPPRETVPPVWEPVKEPWVSDLDLEIPAPTPDRTRQAGLDGCVRLDLCGSGFRG